jgi:hypothetical protein
VAVVVYVEGGTSVADVRAVAVQYRAVATRYHEVGQQLGEKVAAERGELPGPSGAWGEDETGEQFAKNYLPAAGQALAALSGLARAMSGIGETLTASITALQGRDDAGGRGFTSLSADA